MSFVINELEVIIEEAPREGPITTRPDIRPRSETPGTMRPADILRIITWHEKRMERLAAE
jgi:hypothetical protein